MAYRRSLSIRSNFIARRINPSFSYVIDDDDRKHQSRVKDSSQGHINTYLQLRNFGSFQPCSFPSCMGFDFHRHMSTSIGNSSENIDIISDVTGVISDTAMVDTVVSQAPVMSEVAIAAAESWPPVAALQYLIDGVHSFTGLNWWASIVITTLLIRGATIPLLLNQLKATTKLTLMRPKLDAIKQEMESKGMMDQEAVSEGKRKMNVLFNEYGVTPFTPIKGLFIQGPVFVSFFLGISNMAEKVPSFKQGGALWFTDLTTADSLYIFPILTAVTFLITVECNMQEGMEGNPMAGTMKKFSRGIAVLTVPFTMHFPKAVFCYWVTSNLFSLTYGQIIKRPAVKKYFGVPDIPPPPPGTVPPPAFSLSAAYKQYKKAFEQRTALPPADEPPSSSTGQPKLLDRKVSSSSAISQRIRTLEKQVKGKKKNKKI